MKKASLSALFLAGFLTLSGAQSQEAPGLPGWKIQDISVVIEGWTSELALRRKLDLKEGLVLSSPEAVEAYRKDLEQRLTNLRTVESFELALVPREGDDRLLDLRLKIKDSWNVIALPYFNYNTNDGMTLSLRGRDYNFLGSLEPLRVNFDYKYDENQRSTFVIDADFNLPFEALGWVWTWNLSQAADFRWEHPWGWTLNTSLAASRDLVPGLGQTWKISEGLRLNELGADDTIPYGVKVLHRLDYGLGMKITDQLLFWRDVSYGPGVFLEASNSPQKTDGPLLSASAGVSHGISGGRVDWKGNLRDGTSFRLGQSLSYNLLAAAWGWDLSGETQVHLSQRLSWWNAGTSLRAGAWYAGGTLRDTIGSYTRGVVDRRLSGFWGGYLNWETPVTVMLWDPVTWFGWSWAKFSTFEMMVSPVLDLAAVDKDGSGLEPNEFWAGGGLEVLVFSGWIRSFFVRASLAYDLQAVWENKSLSKPSPRDDDEIREISIGLGFFY